LARCVCRCLVVALPACSSKALSGANASPTSSYASQEATPVPAAGSVRPSSIKKAAAAKTCEGTLLKVSGVVADVRTDPIYVRPRFCWRGEVQPGLGALTASSVPRMDRRLRRRRRGAPSQCSASAKATR